MLLVVLRQIVALSHVVEAEQLQHHVMDHVLAGLDQRDGMVARIDVEKVAGKRPQPVIAELELQHLLVKLHHVGEPLDVHHDVAHAERAGAEAGDVAAGLERFGRDRGAVEELQAVAGRIVDHDQVFDVALVGQRARAARHLGADFLKARRQRVERRSIRHLPAEEADALPAVGVHHQALLAVVHAERHALRVLSIRCRPRKFWP